MKRDIFYVIIIVLLSICLSMSTTRCNTTKNKYDNNIEALVDSINYYKSRDGMLVASRLAFETDIDNLKKLNADLYNQIDRMKLKAKNVDKLVQMQTLVEQAIKDTTYIITHDTITTGFDKRFDFSNEHRILTGNARYNNDSLSIMIDKDIVNVDLSIGIDKDNRIFATSSNPYVKYESMTAFSIPKQKQKRWMIGPALSYGYNPIDNKATFSIGIGISYGIITF